MLRKHRWLLLAVFLPVLPIQAEWITRDFLYRPYVFGGIERQKDRLLRPIKGTFRSYRLGERQLSNAYEIGVGHTWKHRLWPEFRLYHFDKTGFTGTGGDVNFLAVFFFRHSVPFSAHLVLGGGYGVLTPKFDLKSQWSPHLNVGIGVTVRYSRFFIRSSFIVTVYEIGKFGYGDGLIVNTYSEHQTKINIGLGIRL